MLPRGCSMTTYPYTVGRGLTTEERCDINDAFSLCADLPPPERSPLHGAAAAALSRHALSCAMMSLLGYKPATVRAPCNSNIDALISPCMAAWQCSWCTLSDSRPQFETKTLFAQHARPGEPDEDNESGGPTRAGDVRTLASVGVSLPAFESIMAQKYRFQVRPPITQPRRDVPLNI